MTTMQRDNLMNKWVQLALIAVFVLFAPYVLQAMEQETNFGLLTQVNRALIYVALAQGLNIVVGFAGLLDLGYAAFFAIGAYTFGILTWPSHDIEMSFFLAIWVCAATAALFGVLIGAPTLRLRGDYLAIVTLAFGEIIPTLVRNMGDFTFTLHSLYYVRFIGWAVIFIELWIINKKLPKPEPDENRRWYRTWQTWTMIVLVLVLFGGWEVILHDLMLDDKFTELDRDICTELTGETPRRRCQLVEDINITNGSQGLTPLARPDFSAVERAFDLEPESMKYGVDPVFWYYAIVLVTILILFSARRLDNSRLGRAWKAIREDETAADFMGVDPIRTKLLAFAIGASFSGLAGAVTASMQGSIFPEAFRFQVSIFLLIIVVLSGRGSVIGVLVGGLIISIFDGVFLAQVLPDLFPDTDVQSMRWIFFGIGLIVIMIFRPQGLFPSIGTARGAQKFATGGVEAEKNENVPLA